MYKLIETKDPGTKYQLTDIDLSINLEELYITKEQFETRFKLVSDHFKWDTDEHEAYHKYLWSLNHVVDHNKLSIENEEKNLDFSTSLHPDYPTNQLSINKRMSSGHPYLIRTPKTSVTESDIVDAFYMYRVFKNSKTITELMNKDLRGELFEENAELKFINFGDESYKIKCYPGQKDKTINKHNTSMKALHWGQRKLILSEIRFITKVITELNIDVNDKNIKIPFIYPGAAPGTHFMLLMDMFPQLVLYMWDPAIFIDNLLYTDIYRRTGNINDIPNECIGFVKRYAGRVYICPEMVDDEWNEYLHNVTTHHKEKNLEPQLGFFKDSSLEWIKDNIDIEKAMFISDIRMFTNNDILRYQYVMSRSIYDPILQFLTSRDTVVDHHRDMELQSQWYLKSGIRFGLLKFKLDSIVKIGSSVYQQYPHGEIMLQAWAPYMSTESRLFIDNKKSYPAYYDVKKYGKMMNYFNKNVRHSSLVNEKLSNHGIHLVEDSNGAKITLEQMWRIILNDRIGMDCLMENKIEYDYLKLYKETVSFCDIINLMSDITKSLKFKNPINFHVIMDYNRSRSSVSKRNHFAQYFQNRLDYTSIRTDFNVFPFIEYNEEKKNR